MIKGETSDITVFSKISLVREIGEIIKDFRVTKNRPNKELEVKVSDNVSAETLKTKRTLCNIDIKIIIKKLSRSLNMNQPHEPNNSRTTSWGKIFCEDLVDCEDEDILEQLQIENTNILMAKKILRRSDTGFKPTRLIRIKFGTPQIPSRVLCCLESFKVEPYIPPPKKCAKCKRFGHTAEPCRSQWTHNKCAKNHGKDQACKTNILT